MRLPWPFKRSQPDAEPAPAGEVFGARPTMPQAWRELPVLGTSVGTPPLIAPTPPFRADLAGAAPAPIALAPLTHGHGLDAPAGLARGLARPVDTGTHRGVTVAPALLSGRSRLQRKPADSGGDVSQSPALSAEPLDDSPVPSTTVASAAKASVRPLSTAEPLVTHPRATVANQPAPTTRSFVSAAGQSSLPLPPSGRIATPRATSTAAGPGVAAASATSLVDARIQRAPAAVTVAVPPLALEPPRSAPDGDRLTLGQSRRLGLGAPIDPVSFRQARTNPTSTGLPAVGAAIDRPTLPIATTPSPRSSRDVERPLPLAAQPALPATTRETELVPSLAARPTPDVSMSSSAAIGPFTQAAAHAPATSPSAVPRRAEATTVVQALQGPAPARVAVQRAPRAEASAPVTQRPLVGARPIGPGIQRAPQNGATSAPSEPPGAGSVRVHRGSEANELSGALDARAFTHAGEIYLPDSHGPLSGQKARSLLAHEMTHVTQQRRLGSSLPHEDTAQGQQLEAQASANESGGHLPLAISGAKESGHATSESVGMPPEPSSANVSIGASAVREGAPPQRASRASDAHFTNPDDQFRSQLDSNEAYMFDKFERRLRRLLISERERGGTLIDAL